MLISTLLDQITSIYSWRNCSLEMSNNYVFYSFLFNCSRIRISFGASCVFITVSSQHSFLFFFSKLQTTHTYFKTTKSIKSVYLPDPVLPSSRGQTSSSSVLVPGVRFFAVKIRFGYNCSRLFRLMSAAAV